jgi:arylsulfatase A-like enzyme
MQPPVLLISMDTVREDIFNENCFPQSWDIFTTDFARFPNAISHGVATPHAFPGIVAGHPVIGDGEFPSNATTLPQLFSGETVAFTNNGHVRADRGYDRGFDRFGDLKPPTNRDLTHRSLLDKVKDFEPLQNSTLLKTLYEKYLSLQPDPPYSKPNEPAELITEWLLAQYDDATPDFVWGHYMDAHKPFIPEFAVDGPDVDISPEKLGYINDYDREQDPPKQECRDLLWELYKSNARYVDRELSRFLETIREKDWYEDALIIFVADHGELFGEHGFMWHPMTIDPVDELIDTPLAVKFPNNHRGGDVIEHRVQHADILRTVAEYVDTPEAAPANTYPLLDPAERIIISKSNTSIRVSGPDGHAFKRRDGSTDEYGEVSDEMREKLRGAEFPRVKTSTGNVKGVDDVIREEQLQALGYR